LTRLHLIPADAYEVKVAHEEDKMNIQFDLAYDKLPSMLFNDKMFIQTSLFSVAGFHMPLSSNREQDFYFEYPFIAHDTSIYFLPEGFVLDDKPISEHNAGKYFAYDASTSFDPVQRTLTFISTFELKSHIIKHSDYESALQLYNKIEEMRNRKVVIKKG
jgi:hypothetical protein